MTSKTILVVDDEELLRNAIVFQFKREGFNVLSASNGVEAFEIIKTQKIDAVVSDIQMPGGNGIDLLKAVKEYNSNIPVMVFITAFADITDSEAYDLGANAIFTKPFDRKVLVSCIKNSVEFEGINWKGEARVTEATSKSIANPAAVLVGRGGAFIQLESTEYKIGEIVELNVKASLGPTTVDIVGTGKVLWKRTSSETLPSGIGVEFVSLASETKQVLEKWIQENSVKAYIPLKAA